MGGLRLTRRKVLAAGAGLLRPALGANEKLDLAFIGVGGRGSENLKRLSAHNVVALCDVDWRPIRDADWPRAAELAAHYPRAKRFVDFRRMLDRMHRSIEKPLAHPRSEVRVLMGAAREYQVATRMGNQGHSSADVRLIVECIRAGALGTVREVHIAGRSAQGANREANRRLIQERPPVPDGLSWDLWLGATRCRRFHPAYHPVGWRNFVAFGGGTIGDFTCHYLDRVCWVLDLGSPAENQETFPDWATVRYVFPAGRRAITVTWHADQDLPSPPGWPKHSPLPAAGRLVIGSNGALAFGRVMPGRPDRLTRGMVRLYPDELDRSYRRPALLRFPDHWEDWVESCETGKPAGSHFGYGGPLTEIALPGNIALRRKPARLRFEARRRRFTNDEEAKRLLDPPACRKGGSL